MSDWKEQLNKRIEELNLKKEENNESETNRVLSSDRVDNSRSSNSDSISKNSPNSNNFIGDRSRNLFPGGISKEINKDERRKEIMITREAALDDLDKIDVNAPVGKIIVEVGRILVKILTTIRNNQLLTDEDKSSIKKAKAERKPNTTS